MARGDDAPPTLVSALRYAVFPGGARIRPRLCLAVARACAEDRPQVSDAAAAAIELLHCASLVHDDLPCFDDAAKRRGRPSVHKAFGERIAVLTGDALDRAVFPGDRTSREAVPKRLVGLVGIVARSVGSPSESLPARPGNANRRSYWRLISAPRPAHCSRPRPRPAPAPRAMIRAVGIVLGERIGEAYQIADDIRDVVSNESELGKPTGRDQVLGRPNAVNRLGLGFGRRAPRGSLVQSAIDVIPGLSPARPIFALTFWARPAGCLPRELARPAA